MDKRSADTIINSLKEIIESKKSVPRDTWLEAAFDLNLLRIDEAQLLNKMMQVVAQEKLKILKGQEKKNVAAAELEIQATDEFRFMRDQMDKLYSIDEFVRIAKKSADLDF